MDVEKIVSSVIDCAYKVRHELMNGYLESVYENALMLELRNCGINAENQLAVIIDNKVIGGGGIVLDGVPYVEYSIVRDCLNNRFYVDFNENILLYTLPEGTISANVGSNEYMLQKEKHTVEYPKWKEMRHILLWILFKNIQILSLIHF